MYRNHKFSLRAMSIVLAVPIALILTTVVALGHHINSISGTVNCEGDYSITVNGDVFNQTTLIVSLDGTEIFNGPTGQSGDADPDATYGPFVGTGASAGDLIEANTSEGDDYVSNNLVLTQEVCETDTPSPTETPSETPVATPVVTPSETPTATIPNTSLGSDGDGNGVVFTFIGLLVIGLSLMLIASAVFGKKKS